MRNSVRFAQEKFKGNTIVAAELGVHLGLNAALIIEALNIGKIYLVDDYKYIQTNPEYFNSDKRHQEAMRILEPYKDVCEWFIESTATAHEHIKDQSLDFLYVDADHAYESVKRDIELWYPKVKIGGIMGGHDYLEELEPDVEKAVTEFIQKNNLNLTVVGKDWWVVK